LSQLEDDLGRYSETEQPLANATRDTNPLPVTFKSVSFAYPDQGDQVLNTIDLILSPGEMVALSGPSGRGKTTLLDMIAGLMPPDDGRIEHGGKSIHDCKYEGALRSQIAYLSQDAFLFDVSLRENMVWGGREASDSEIADALQIAAADGIVARLPEGLETRAGERGQLFSGGERQRLCLAAKLLRRPKLLLLDEATGAIDRETELGILSRLRELRSDMTILLATHRPVDHGTFDAIWAMEEGGRLAVVSRPS
ncbi:MAG: ABC transporter ATP-binding protein, partial [Pseudomonadota bacterium]